MRGPIDYLVVGFAEKKFTGEILKELEKAVDNGVIAVLDIAIIVRDETGRVSALELNDEAVDRLFHVPSSERERMISDEDIAEVGELLEDGTTAGCLIVEQLWAKGLKQAIINTGGVLINEGRIHPEAAKELEEEGAN